MSEARPITIVGGGLAGLTLGLLLRRQQVPVRIQEAGHYPRHRVCGEFISGRGLGVLSRLGLCEDLVREGALSAATAAFFAGQAGSGSHPLRPPGLCVSRWVLDALLAQRFRTAEGQLQEGTRWQGHTAEPGLVVASGRRPRLSRRSPQWFGLKAHASQVSLAADLEMHRVPSGYVGLCRLANGQVNICGLFRKPPGGSAPAEPWHEKLRGPPGSLLSQRLESAVFDQASFCAVAGLDLRSRHASHISECRLGDALTMIPPITGNGMSMAFEAAELAAGPLSCYSRGEISWEAARDRVAAACDAAFGRRLRWAAWLQRLFLCPGIQGRWAGTLLRSNRVWQAVFERTR